MLLDIGLSSILGGSVSAHKGNSKNKQTGLHQLKTFSTAKETNNKMKKQTTKWKKLFPNNMCNRGYYLNYIKKTYNILKTSLIKKQPEYLNRHFSKEDTEIAKRQMERCSTSLIIWEIIDISPSNLDSSLGFIQPKLFSLIHPKYYFKI